MALEFNLNDLSEKLSNSEIFGLKSQNDISSLESLIALNDPYTLKPVLEYISQFISQGRLRFFEKYIIYGEESEEHNLVIFMKILIRKVPHYFYEDLEKGETIVPISISTLHLHFKSVRRNTTVRIYSEENKNKLEMLINDSHSELDVYPVEKPLPIKPSFDEDDDYICTDTLEKLIEICDSLKRIKCDEVTIKVYERGIHIEGVGRLANDTKDKDFGIIDKEDEPLAVFHPHNNVIVKAGKLKSMAPNSCVQFFFKESKTKDMLNLKFDIGNYGELDLIIYKSKEEEISTFVKPINPLGTTGF